MKIYLLLIIQLISGALGGNVAGKLVEKLSLGIVGNSIAGILGGTLGGQLLRMSEIGADAGGMDMANIMVSVASGVVGGGILMAIIGAIKIGRSK